MKKKYIIINTIICIFIVVLGYLLISFKQNCQDTTCPDKSTLNNSDINTDKLTEKDYDCHFTQTWHVVNLLDDYIAEVPEWSYIVLDMYQSHSAYAHLIPTNLKEDLEVGKYYEFTYHIKGRGTINDFQDINKYLVLDSSETSDSSKLTVTLTIEKTDKQGVEQIQENICE